MSVELIQLCSQKVVKDGVSSIYRRARRRFLLIFVSCFLLPPRKRLNFDSNCLEKPSKPGSVLPQALGVYACVAACDYIDISCMIQQIKLVLNIMTQKLTVYVPNQHMFCLLVCMYTFLDSIALVHQRTNLLFCCVFEDWSRRGNVYTELLEFLSFSSRRFQLFTSSMVWNGSSWKRLLPACWSSSPASSPSSFRVHTTVLPSFL